MRFGWTFGRWFETLVLYGQQKSDPSNQYETRQTYKFKWLKPCFHIVNSFNDVFTSFGDCFFYIKLTLPTYEKKLATRPIYPSDNQPHLQLIKCKKNPSFWGDIRWRLRWCLTPLSDPSQSNAWGIYFRRFGCIRAWENFRRANLIAVLSKSISISWLYTTLHCSLLSSNSWIYSINYANWDRYVYKSKCITINA